MLLICFRVSHKRLVSRQLWICHSNPSHGYNFFFQGHFIYLLTVQNNKVVIHLIKWIISRAGRGSISVSILPALMCSYYMYSTNRAKVNDISQTKLFARTHVNSFAIPIKECLQIRTHLFATYHDRSKLSLFAQYY